MQQDNDSTQKSTVVSVLLVKSDCVCLRLHFMSNKKEIQIFLKGLQTYSCHKK